MTIEEMREIRKEKGISYALIAEKAEIPVTTVMKVFTGESAHPRFATMMAIEKAFFDLGVAGDRRPGYGYLAESPTAGVIRETPSAYPASERSPSAYSLSSHQTSTYQTSAYRFKQQGEYTLEDYYALPDDVRVELIDGVFYDMAAPGGLHQMIAGEIYRQIANFIIERDGPCIPYIGPRDVQLDCDDDTMVQPDVMILCAREKNKNRVIFGAPDFVLEVISPSTGRRDYTKKLVKYMEAGVREYWIVDPKKKYVVVHYFEEEDCTRFYPIGLAGAEGGTEDRPAEGGRTASRFEIPVNIYNGELVISFRRIAEWIEEGWE